MTSKRVLVTGASGFIGQLLVRALHRAGYAVRAATRRPVPFPNAVDVAIVPDLRNPVNWDTIVRGIDIVIHAAGHAHVYGSDEPLDLFTAVNTMRTDELVRAAARASVERFLLISSVRAQTGASAVEAVREQDEVRPTDNYGRSKLAAELAIQAVAVPFTILRPVVVYGRKPKGNIKLLVRLASLPLPLPVGNLNSRRSLLGIDNLIFAIFFVLNNPATIGETYLVADPKPLTIRKLFTMLREAQGRRPWLVKMPSKLLERVLTLTSKRQLWERVAGDLVVDTTKLESLGWRAPMETYDGLRAMLSTENCEGLRANRAQNGKSSGGALRSSYEEDARLSGFLIPATFTCS
jgi:UDP-glucose 4-epimerase